MQAIHASTANLEPDYQNNILERPLHSLAFQCTQIRQVA